MAWPWARTNGARAVRFGVPEIGKAYPDAGFIALLGAFGKQEEIPLIEVGSSFRAAASSGPLYYDWDGHMTAAGHQVLAEHVLQDPQVMRALDELRQQLDLTSLNR